MTGSLYFMLFLSLFLTGNACVLTLSYAPRMVNDGQFSTTAGEYYSIIAAAINVYTRCFVNEKCFSPLSFNLHWFRQAFENYS